jgi:CheY-like chemotaxis protein
MLRFFEIEAETSLSGIDAIERLQQGKSYDVIFMDHMMPEMDGIETTLKLREMGYTGKIVALTANAMAGNAEMFLQNGFDDFLSKPLDAAKLGKLLSAS